MLTPEELSLIPDSFDGLFQQLDEYIIKDYARMAAKAGKVTDTAEWMRARAEQIGLSEEEIQKETARILNMSQEDIEQIFEDAAFTSAEADVSRFASAGLSAERIATSAFLGKYIKAAIKQTNGSLENLTGTFGVVSDHGAEDLTTFYRRTLDFAQLQVSNGVVDYNTAIRNAIKALAAKGIQQIDYESGHHMNIASAARMCILTGVNQLARHMNDAICDELGLDLVEVTAHAGARPSHKTWQGQIYSRSGKSKKYEDLYAATRLGEVDGLCGANCRHNYYGYLEGTPRAWSDEELANIDPPPFKYDGKEYTYYEAGQRMRYMERQIRKTKREAVGYEAAGLDDDFTAASIKLNRQRQEYKKFAKASKIRPKWERTQELGFNRSVSGKAVWRNRRKTSGAKETFFEKIMRKDRQAEEYYERARKDDSDVKRIAKYTGMSEKKIQRIKDHLFHNAHMLDDGKKRKFDADYDIALAWQRLSEGRGEKRDILLLKHEYLESCLERKYNLTYREAHDLAEKKYPWDKEIERLFGEDGEDGILNGIK